VSRRLSSMPQLSHSIPDLVRSRVSTRGFSDRELEPEIRSALADACRPMTSGLLKEKAEFRLADKPSEKGSRSKVTDYGFITGARYYLWGVVEPSPLAYESYGYLMEHLVLKATDLGLQTCWLGYFHPEFLTGEAPRAEGVFPAAVIVGYGTDSWKGRLVRLAVQAARRKAWGRLFFLSDFKTPLSTAVCGVYAEALEMVRLAPSAGNLQPWRIVHEPARPAFHFYLRTMKAAYHDRHLHEVDIGIALCHFELAARCRDLKGRWIIDDPGFSPPDPQTRYRLTWLGF